jgi:hypothetical protein
MKPLKMIKTREKFLVSRGGVKRKSDGIKQ